MYSYTCLRFSIELLPRILSIRIYSFLVFSVTNRFTQELLSICTISFCLFSEYAQRNSVKDLRHSAYSPYMYIQIHFAYSQYTNRFISRILSILYTQIHSAHSAIAVKKFLNIRSSLTKRVSFYVFWNTRNELQIRISQRMRICIKKYYRVGVRGQEGAFGEEKQKYKISCKCTFNFCMLICVQLLQI
jgi:hypothetical protein